MHPTDSQIARLGRRPVSLILLGVAALAISWRLALALQGVDLFSDDAYYYMVIARNFVETGRFTFDGLSQTSGFHPLLFWMEAAGFSLLGTGSSPMTQYLGVFVGMAAVFLLTIGGCLLIANRPARSDEDRVLQDALLIALCVILVPRFTKSYLGGMEAVLVLPLLILVGLLAWRARYALAGIGALLLVMARLDTLPYVVFPIALACAWRERARGWPAVRSCLLVVMPPVIGTSLLMLWHLRYFGHPVPISGVLKSCFPKIHFQWEQLFGSPRNTITLTCALLAAVVATGLLLRSGRATKEVRGAGLTAAALGLVQLATFVLFQKWSKPIPAWYLGPVVLTGAFALSVGVANVVGLRRLRVLTVAAAVLVLAINLASLARTWYSGALHRAVARESLADRPGRPISIVDLAKAQPRDLTWASTDCGKLAFWGDRRVINLDGLVNDFKYQDQLRDQRLAAYLVDNNVKYLIFSAWDRPQGIRGRPEPMYKYRVAPEVFSGDYQTAEFYVYSYKHMTYSDRIRLPRAAEVWRSEAEPDGRAMCKAIVFDLDIALRDVDKPAVAHVAARTE